MSRPLVIDAHCHAGLGDGFRGPWDTEARLDAYLERMARADIDRTVVFPVFNNDYAAANNRLARIVAREPGRLIGFAAVNPTRDAGRTMRMIGRAVEVHGFRGIKVHGMDSFPGREVCAAAQRWGLPVLVDVVRRTAAIEMLATQYPDVNFIVPHLGGFADDWMVHLQVIDQLVRFPNVYADTSGVRYFDALVEAVRRAGPEKLVFGSDGPQLHPGVELYKIRVMGLPAAAQALVTGGNIARLLGPGAPSSPGPRVRGSRPRPGLKGRLAGV
ncbi:MAG: amidohydrolase family protein [Trebonia sp.]|jgi:predicted TIM-barrel fold metal-dependent hydrolase